MLLVVDGTSFQTVIVTIGPEAEASLGEAEIKHVKWDQFMAQMNQVCGT